MSKTNYTPKKIPSDISSYLNYDAERGVLVYIKIPKGNMYRKIGDIVSTKSPNGVYKVNFKGTRYLLHRVAWFLYTGKQANIIDHINGNPSDNRIVNLRSCTQHQNTMNCNKPKNNTSGYKGVSQDSRNGRWIAYIKHNYKKIHIGSFKNKKDAIKARKEREIIIQGEFRFNG